MRFMVTGLALKGQDSAQILEGRRVVISLIRFNHGVAAFFIFSEVWSKTVTVPQWAEWLPRTTVGGSRPASTLRGANVCSVCLLSLYVPCCQLAQSCPVAVVHFIFATFECIRTSSGAVLFAAAVVLGQMQAAAYDSQFRECDCPWSAIASGLRGKRLQHVSPTLLWLIGLSLLCLWTEGY